MELNFSLNIFPTLFDNIVFSKKKRIALYDYDRIIKCPMN